MIIFHRKMSNPNDMVKSSYERSLNITASMVLVIWVGIIVLGIISLINTVLHLDSPFFWSISYENPFLYIIFILGIFPSRKISNSIMNLISNKHWIEPLKFIKSMVILLIFASIASILTIIIYKANNFAEFFSLFSSFSLLFSFTFLSFCLYYYRYELPKDQMLRSPNI